jgi:hypothetical protein
LPVSLKVAADAIRIAGPVPAALSLLLGATLFSASNALLTGFGAAHRKRCGECVQQPCESQQPGSGVVIALGNAFDGLPEALVLGIALRDQVVPVALVVAFSLGNFPRGILERIRYASSRQMLEKFRQISTVLKQMGHEPMRLLTDVTGEPYWTIVAEANAEKIVDFFAIEQTRMANETLRKAMADYHDLVASGRREIYRLES